MRSLKLDFVRDPGAGRPTGIVLIATGALLLLWLFGQYADARTEAARWDSKLSDTRRLARRALPDFAVEQAPTREIAQEIRAANVVIDQLALPWDRLFVDLESAVTGDVALLGVQPDPKNRTVILQGEARDLNALLTFLARLEATPGLRDAHLTQHEIRTKDPNHPMAFTVQAAWTPAR